MSKDWDREWEGPAVEALRTSRAKPAAEVRRTQPRRPMTLNVLIALLTDLRDAHGGGTRVLLRQVDVDAPGRTVLTEPDPEVMAWPEDWPDADVYFPNADDLGKVVVL